MYQFIPGLIFACMILIAYSWQQAFSHNCGPSLNFTRRDEYCILEGNGSRCFCLNDTHSTWEAATQTCASLSPTNDSRLAIDDSTVSHDVLVRLMKDARSRTAWLGARTTSMYFNWMVSRDIAKPLPVYYQGCNLSPVGDLRKYGEITSRADIPHGCHDLCRMRQAKYFGISAVEKRNRVRICGSTQTITRTHYDCFCGNYLGNPVAFPTGCLTCSGCPDMKHMCGNATKTLAIYSTHATTTFHDWRKEKPLNNSDICLAYWYEKGHDWSYEELWCNIPLPLHSYGSLHFCWRDPGPGQECSTLTGEEGSAYSRRCYREIQSAPSLTFRQLAEECDRYNASLITLRTDEDREDVRRSLHPSHTTFGPMWLGGSSMRWAWFIDSSYWQEMTSDSGFWLQREALSIPGLCMVFKNNSHWEDRECDEKHHFICELTKITLPSETTASLETASLETSTTESTPTTVPTSDTVPCKNNSHVDTTTSTILIIMLTFTLMVLLAMVLLCIKERQRNSVLLAEVHGRQNRGAKINIDNKKEMININNKKDMLSDSNHYSSVPNWQKPPKRRL